MMYYNILHVYIRINIYLHKIYKCTYVCILYTYILAIIYMYKCIYVYLYIGLYMYI